MGPSVHGESFILELSSSTCCSDLSVLPLPGPPGFLGVLKVDSGQWLEICTSFYLHIDIVSVDEQKFLSALNSVLLIAFSVGNMSAAQVLHPCSTSVAPIHQVDFTNALVCHQCRGDQQHRLC